MENIIFTRINIGVGKPFKLLHITDVHITEANECDTDEHKLLMKERTEVFREEGKYPEKSPSEYFRESIDISKSEDATVICTGDVMDIHTYGNLAEFRALTEGVDMMFTPGGHEHQRAIVRTMEEPYPYAKEIRAQLEDEFSRFDLSLESRVINGVNVITADNSLDYYSEKTLKAFKRELEKGYPVIVFSHDPIWDKLLNATDKTHENVFLTPDDYRISHEMIDLLLNHPLVITTVAGHGHAFEEREINGKIHYMTDGLFKGAARLIEVM